MAQAERVAPSSDPRDYCGFCCELAPPESLLTCAQCGNSGHPSCGQIEPELEARIRANPFWLCFECKVCIECVIAGNDNKLLLCDYCDDGVHTYCLDPPLDRPPRGDFFCPNCTLEVRSSGSGTATRTMSSRRAAACAAAAAAVDTAASAASASSRQASKRAPSSKRSKSSAGESARSRSSRDRSKTGRNRNARQARDRRRSAASPVAVAQSAPAMGPLDVLAALKVPVAEKQRFVRSQAASRSALKTVHVKARYVVLAGFKIKAWYAAPYPEEYATFDTLYLCEFCLKYMASQEELVRHMDRCTCYGQPPGDEIYRHDDLQFWEVDGSKSKVYCQNLCLLAKQFLQSKTLYYDVEPFLFYALTQRDATGAHLVGYFSKQKNSAKEQNVSCILTLPHAMRRGFGQLLIDFSYLLTRHEGIVGTPERPLSHLGAEAYAVYWQHEIAQYLVAHQHDAYITLDDIGRATGIMPKDAVEALQRLNMLCFDDAAAPAPANGSEEEITAGVALHINPDSLASLAANAAKRKRITLDPKFLHWIPTDQRPKWL